MRDNMNELRDLYHKKTYLKQKLISNADVITRIPSPCYVLSHDSLESNLKILAHVANMSNAKILVALKGYSFWREFEGIRRYLHGATCSGVYEARLAYEEIATHKDSCMQECATEEIMKYKDSLQERSTHECRHENNGINHSDITDTQSHINAFKKEICVFSPAYKESQMQEIIHYATHIIFNSFVQWQRFKPIIDAYNQGLQSHHISDANYDSKQTKLDLVSPIQVGLRINPLYSEVEPPIYNPCIPKSRLGITPQEFQKDLAFYAKQYGFTDSLTFFKHNFSGLHFHTHCEQDSSALQRTLPYVIKYFDPYIQESKWINFGGGHHITRQDYDYRLLIELIKDFKQQYHNIEVLLEPGEAIGWQTGDLIGEVIDIIQNDGNVAILDVSASCHMPDCLEMPYRPQCYKISYDKDSKQYHIEDDLGENIGKYCYRFGGPTCLAGDVIGDYSFHTPLKVGDRVAFCDMMHYTIVKNTTFNGVELPSLGVFKNNNFELLKTFSYNDFKDRN